MFFSLKIPVSFLSPPNPEKLWTFETYNDKWDTIWDSGLVDITDTSTSPTMQVHTKCATWNRSIETHGPESSCRQCT